MFIRFDIPIETKNTPWRLVHRFDIPIETAHAPEKMSRLHAVLCLDRIPEHAQSF
jgi:hypothetical protein